VSVGISGADAASLCSEPWRTFWSGKIGQTEAMLLPAQFRMLSRANRCCIIRGMSLSVTYSSMRREVMRLYWVIWRQRLWKMHIAIFVAALTLLSLAMFGGWPAGVAQLATVFLLGLAPILLLALYPVLVFKPHTRILTVDDKGIATTIGKRSQVLAWEDIADVKNCGDSLIIQRRNLNAFIVPVRAFETNEARSSFETFVRSRMRANGR